LELFLEHGPEATKIEPITIKTAIKKYFSTMIKTKNINIDN